jgi:plastocyanin
VRLRVALLLAGLALAGVSATPAGASVASSPAGAAADAAASARKEADRQRKHARTRRCTSKRSKARTATFARPSPLRSARTDRRARVRRPHRLRCAPPRRRPAEKLPAGSAPTAPGTTTAPGAPGSEDETAPGGSDPAPPPLPDTGTGARSLSVGAGEFWLTLSKPSVSAGNVRVEFNNRQAEDPHDLHLEREDGTGARYSFGTLDSGEVASRTLALDAGTWSLFCALPEHAEHGMTARLVVNDG